MVRTKSLHDSASERVARRVVVTGLARLGHDVAAKGVAGGVVLVDIGGRHDEGWS